MENTLTKLTKFLTDNIYILILIIVAIIVVPVFNKDDDNQSDQSDTITVKKDSTKIDSTKKDSVVEPVIKYRESMFFENWDSYYHGFKKKISEHKPFFRSEECGMPNGILVNSNRIKYSEKHPGYDEKSMEWYDYYQFKIIRPDGSFSLIKKTSEEKGYQYHTLMPTGSLILDSTFSEKYIEYRKYTVKNDTTRIK